MSVRLRPCATEDAAELARLFRRSVEQVGPRDYSARQVAAWAARGPTAEAFARRAADGRLMLAAEDPSGALLGFIDLEADGHIDMLYCAPEAVGAGVAGLLFEAVERAARERGQERLYSEASEAARRFFLKHGFRVLHRRDLVVEGVPIHNFAVEKRLR